jgi:hypothetical protein
MMHVNTLLPFLSAFSAALAFPAHDKPLQSRNESSALALLSGYTDDSCDGFPIGNYVLDFEGMGVCEGNGTVAKAINIQKLAPGCVGEFEFVRYFGDLYSSHLSNPDIAILHTLSTSPNATMATELKLFSYSQRLDQRRLYGRGFPSRPSGLLGRLHGGRQ